jgi:hypothetical protein
MKKTQWILASLILVSLASCGTQSTTISQPTAEEKVKIELKEETAVKREDVKTTTREYIMKSNSLTTDQKTKLLNLQEKTLAKVNAIDEDINKTKMVLIKTLMQQKPNPKEVGILKNDLRKLSKKQINVSIKAFEDAQAIISPIKDQADKEYLFNRFMLKQNNSY